MVNVFDELIVSGGISQEPIIFHWKQGTRGIFNCFKDFQGNFLFIENEAANVLTACLLNQMTLWRHIRTWYYDAVFVNRNGHYFIKRTT